MAERARLLLLGGTSEAVALAGRAAPDPRLVVISSLAGLTRKPAKLPGPVRVGGFGGTDGLVRFLRDERIDLLVDATHPFAATMSKHAAAACAEAGVPRLMVVRPPWQARPGDIWLVAENVVAAAATLERCARRAFLTTGRRDIPAFADLAEVWFLVRLIEPADRPLPLARHQVVVGRPPFTEADEIALLQAHEIDAVVAKNSGGELTYGKIAAARRLGLPVVMVRRPAATPGAAVASVAEALAWIDNHLD